MTSTSQSDRLAQVRRARDDACGGCGACRGPAARAGARPAAFMSSKSRGNDILRRGSVRRPHQFVVRRQHTPPPARCERRRRRPPKISIVRASISGRALRRCWSMPRRNDPNALGLALSGHVCARGARVPCDRLERQHQDRRAGPGYSRSSRRAGTDFGSVALRAGLARRLTDSKPLWSKLYVDSGRYSATDAERELHQYRRRSDRADSAARRNSKTG